ncbi:hypothetical protein [Candidatus Poriferisocius sp.]|uniref:hypothetical protein n=1 Tax=Candidatus Poriferisocius sp. TaxID=3101276 RepID=UPI003B5C8DFD
MGTKHARKEAAAFRSQTEEFIESMDGLRWLVHLDEDDIDAMLNEVGEALAAHTGAECRALLAYALWDWKATAEAQADPELSRRLSEPIAAVSGEPVPIPAA